MASCGNCSHNCCCRCSRRGDYQKNEREHHIVGIVATVNTIAKLIGWLDQILFVLIKKEKHTH